MIATSRDEKSERVLRAISRKIRPYADADVAMVAKLSLATVRLRLRLLRDAGLIEETWKGNRGPFWELSQ
jgi:hypothetical protein